MKIKIIKNIGQGSDSIEELIGMTFTTHDEFKEFWENGEVEVWYNGGIYPIAPEEYVVVE